MSGASGVMLGARWGVYLVRFALYGAYGLLTFFSKPGSRLLVPALAAFLAYTNCYRVAAGLVSLLVDFDWRHLSWGFYVGMLLWAVCVFVTVASYREHLRPVWLVLRFLIRLAVLLILVVIIALIGGAHLPTLDLSGISPAVIVDMALLPPLLSAVCVYIAFSRLLTVVLGTFPPVVRPLAPMAPLKASGQALKPVRVSLAVPRLS
jgi:hypothetical protein